MVSLYERIESLQKKVEELRGKERRAYRRHDLESQGIVVERWDGGRKVGQPLGTLLDISAGGIRIRTQSKTVKPENQIRVRLTLPEFAGISPFIDKTEGLKPRKEWVGWMTISRVIKSDGKSYEVAGRLVDMEEIDRGMLGLYLSTQPLAA